MPVATAHDELLKLDQVQEILKCSRVTVYQYMKCGMPFVQLGGRRLVCRASLDEWLEQNEQNLLEGSSCA